MYFQYRLSAGEVCQVVGGLLERLEFQLQQVFLLFTIEQIRNFNLVIACKRILIPHLLFAIQFGNVT